jgi:hypothetical protein
MTGAELKEFTENVLDGITIDDDFYYQLLNIAKTKLEEKRLWQYLKKSYNPGAASSSAVDLGALGDFAEDYKVMIGNDYEYLPVPFEEKYAYARSSGRYYIDWANEELYLLGSTIPSGQLYIFYKRFTPSISSGTSPVFPARFHHLLGFYVAAYYQAGIDSDDIFARMSPENRLAALELQRAMEQWDSSIAMRAQNNQIGVAESRGEIPLELM